MTTSRPRQQPWLHELEIAVHGPVTVSASDRRHRRARHRARSSTTGGRADVRLRLDDAPRSRSRRSVGATTELGRARHLGDPAPTPPSRCIAGGVSASTETESITSSRPMRRHRHDSLSIRATATAPSSPRSRWAAPPSCRSRPPRRTQGWGDERHRTTLEAAPPAARSSRVPDGGAAAALAVRSWRRPGPTTVELTWSVRPERHALRRRRRVAGSRLGSRELASAPTTRGSPPSSTGAHRSAST